VGNYMWDNLFRRGDQEQEVLDALRQTIIFSSLSRRELAFLRSTCHVRAFKAGEAVFRQGEIGVGMYVILSGALDISVDPRGGDEDAMAISQLVTQLKAGDFLGELSLIEENSRRTATAIAAEETRLIGFFKPDLLEILERQPAMGVKILLRLCEVLGRRLKETTTRISELKFDIQRMSDKV
jgi:CRP/FNR family transcriptional regulator, cyclic AMP receptor protein